MPFSAFQRFKEIARSRRYRRLIATSPLFASDWYRLTYSKELADGTRPLDHYLAHGANPAFNPGPLFDAKDYLIRYPDVAAAGINPLVHFLNVGAAEHRIAHSVVNESLMDKRGPNFPIPLSHESAARPSIAVVVHVFYPDVFAEICHFLRNIPCHFNLFITTVSEDQQQSVKHILQKNALDAKVLTKYGENRGRNFGPFLVEYAKLIQGHDLMLHLHTKKSLFTGHEQTEWRAHLFQSLLGAKPLVAAIINQFVQNPKLGILYPSTFAGLPYWAHHWLSNSHLITPFFDRIGLAAPSSTGYLDYPAGSMFWARVDALKPLLAANWTYDDFPREDGQNDGTLAHVIERSIVAIAKQQGYSFQELDYSAGCIRDNWSRKNLQQYLTHTKESLLDLIQSTEVISVDIFDTLVTRLSLTPGAVQHYVGCLLSKRYPGTEDFFLVRKEAERAAREKKYYQNDVNLNEIYASFPLNESWTPVVVAYAKELELEVEKRLSQPRREVIDAIQFAHSIGKRVITVSDTYMPREFIEDLLDRHGLGGSVDEIYLSCERGTRKDRGDMWDLLLKSERAGAQLLHIGDNEHSDMQLAGDRRIPTFHVMNPATLLVERGFRVEPGADWQTDIALGPLSARYANSPFLPEHSFTPLRLTSARDLGYCVFGPLFFGFFSWLFRHPVLSRLRHLYFLSREGYFLHKTYNRLRFDHAPQASYFYSSRRAVLSAAQAIRFDPDQIVAGAGFQGTVASLLKTRLGFEPPSDHGFEQVKIRLPDDEPYVREMLEILRDHIQDHSRKEAAALQNYCVELGISGIDAVGIVDIGYRATIQRGLQTVLGKGLVGFYLGTLKESEQVIAGGGNAYGCFAEPTSHSETIPPVVKHSRLIEAFLGAPHGQLLYFQVDQGMIKPVFGPEGVSQLRFNILAEMHAGAEEYCDDLIAAFGPEVLHLEIDLSACQIPLNMFAQHQIVIPTDVSSALSLEDEFCGNGILDLEECFVPYDRRPN